MSKIHFKPQAILIISLVLACLPVIIFAVIIVTDCFSLLRLSTVPPKTGIDPQLKTITEVIDSLNL